MAEPLAAAQATGGRERRERCPGLEAEFEAIYRREFPAVLRFARRSVDHDTANDVVQQAFCKFWKGYLESPPLVFRVDAPDLVRIEIFQAVHNRLRTVTRAATRFHQRQDAIRNEIIRQYRTDEAAKRAPNAVELSAAIDRAVDALPPRQREVFHLVKGQNMRYETAAAILEISVATVHQHLVKANRALRRDLKGLPLPEPEWWFPIDEAAEDEVDDHD